MGLIYRTGGPAVVAPPPNSTFRASLKSSRHWPVIPRSAGGKIGTFMEATLVEETQEMHRARTDWCGLTAQPLTAASANLGAR